MEQTSKLSIVVDTRNAEGQIKSFRQRLNEVESDSKKMDKTLTNIGSKTQFAGLITSIKSAQSALQAFSGTTKNSVSSLNAFNLAAKTLQTSTSGISSNLNSAQVAMAKFANSSKSISANLQTANTGIAQTQTNLMKIIGSFNFASNASGKLSVSAKTLKVDIAALNAALVTGSGALGRFGQASSAASTKLGAFNSSDFKGMAASIRGATSATRSFASTAENTATAVRKLSVATKELRTASTGINVNFKPLGTAATSATKFGAGMRTAAAATVALNKASQSTNANLTRLNTSLNTGASSLNKFSQAAVTAGQRLNIFGRAATQTQTRLNGLNANLGSVRASMANLATSANSINAIFGNLDRTMAQLAAATNRLSDASARAAAQINRLDGGLGGANRQARGFMGTLNSLQGVLSGGLLAISGVGILKTADAMQSLNSQIKLVTSSEEEYLGIKQLLRGVADRNYSDIEATTGLYQKSARALANLGKSQADTIQFTEGVSLAMRTGGRSALEQSSAIYQLSQSMGAGIVNGDEFRTITESAPLLLQLVAKEMGVTTGALKKLSSEGKITSEVMYNAINNNIPLLKEMARQMPLTMGQGFTLIKTGYKTFVDNMMNETGGLSSKIALSLAIVSTKFDVMAKGAIALGTLAFIQFAGSVNVAAKAMALFNIVMKANPIVLVATAVLGVASAVYGLEDVLDTTGLMFGDLMDAMSTGFNGLGDLAWAISQDISNAFVGSNDTVSQSYIGFFDDTAKGFSGFLQGIGRVVAAATATFNGFFFWIGNGFWQALRVAGNAFIWLGNTAKSIVSKAGSAITDLINGALGGLNWLSSKANDILDKTPLTWRFKAVGEVEWRNPNYKETPYFAITGDTLGGNIGKNLDVLMPAVDNYFKDLSERSEAKRAAATPYTPSTGEMDPKLAQMHRDQQAKDAADAAQEKADKAKGKKSGGNKGAGSNASYIEYANQNGTRNQKLDAELVKKLSFLEDTGIVFRVTSGGQPAKGSGGKRVGSTGHDGGMAGDGRFIKDGRVLSALNPSDMPILRAIVEEAAARGVTGIGTDYMGATVKANKELFHLGIQKTPATWGKGESSKNSPNWLKESFIAGRKRQKDDSFLGKYDARQQSVIDEENKKLEEQLKLQSELRAQYGSEDLRLSMELQKEFAKIASSGLSADEQDRMAVLAQQDKDRKLAIYEKGLQDQLVSLTEYQKTGRYLIEQARKDEKFKALNNEDLARPENAKILQDTLDAIDAKYDYDEQRYEMTLDKQKREMYSFRATDRDLLKDSYDDQISDAMSMYDELKDYRVAALTEEKKYRLDLFDLGQAQQMLELKKSTMTEMGYIKAKYDLERKLAGLSNDSPEIKAAQDIEAKRAFDEAQAEIQNRVKGDFDRQTRVLLGQTEEFVSLKESFKSQYDIAGKAFDEGAVQLEEYHQRLLDLDADYVSKKQSIIVGGYQSAFGMAANVIKAFGGEQSGIYRAIFAVEKAFAFSRVLLENKVALAKAWSSYPFPYNLPGVASVALQTGVLSAAITAISPQGFKTGGYTGSMGINDVAGVVHGQEYVFDAQATKRIGVDNLNAMRRGEAPKGGGDVNVSVNMINNSSYPLQATSDGKTITISDVRNEARNEAKRAFSNLQNPNSHESKMVNRNVQAPRRR